MRPIKFNRGVFATLVAFVLMAGCAPLIGAYSPTAYENATSLKAETLAVMDKANEPYASHQTSVEQLDVELGKAYEYVKGLPGNGISARQWEILIKKDGDLTGKFFSRWEKKHTLSRAYIDEYKLIIGDAFDEIICLEANKEKATDCTGSAGAK